jgi:membrane protease YdiL (CAAX protease family)
VKIILEFLIVFCAYILPGIVLSMFMLRDRDLLKRSAAWLRIVSGAISSFAVAALVYYIATNHPGGPAAFGLSLQVNLPLALVVGGLAAGYLLFIVLVGELRLKSMSDEQKTARRAVFEASGFTIYTGFWQKSGFLASVWLGILAEDFVFRGYLVLGLASLTGVTWPWVLLSTALSVVGHLYQGWRPAQIFTHTFFALLFIIVSVSTGSVFAAVLPHLVYDTAVILRGWTRYRPPAPAPAGPVG